MYAIKAEQKEVTTYNKFQTNTSKLKYLSIYYSF